MRIRKSLSLERLKGIPVIFISGVDQHVHSVYSSDEDFKDYLERFRSFHADGFLEKPIGPEYLLEEVDEFVHH